MLKVELPLTLIICEHWGGNTISTGKVDVIDILSVERLPHVHDVTFAHHVVDHGVDGTNGPIRGEDFTVGVDLSAIKVGGPVLGYFLPKSWHAGYWSVLMSLRFIINSVLKMVQ